MRIPLVHKVAVWINYLKLIVKLSNIQWDNTMEKLLNEWLLTSTSGQIEFEERKFFHDLFIIIVHIEVRQAQFSLHAREGSVGCQL